MLMWRWDDAVHILNAKLRLYTVQRTHRHDVGLYWFIVLYNHTFFYSVTHFWTQAKYKYLQISVRWFAV